MRCYVQSFTKQECNISPGTVSHVNRFDEINASNLKEDLALSTFCPKKLDWFIWFADAKLTGITEQHKKSIMFDKQSSTY